MPNQPDVNNTSFCVRIPRLLLMKVKRDAEVHKMSLGSYIRWVLDERTTNILLTAEDYETIAMEIRNAKSRK